MTQRVLIINVPSLLQQIIKDALANDEQAEIIECESGEDYVDVDLLQAIEQHQPDVIVTTLAEQLSGSPFDEAFAKDTGRRVLAIERVGRSAYLFSVHPEPISLGEMSMGVLVKAVHGDLEEH